MFKFVGAILVLAVGSALAATTCEGAELYSKSTVKYGRWEVRMKAAATPGSVSSFFTYNNNSYLGTPNPWREIDIEVLGNKPNAFQSNIISGTAEDKTTSEDVHNVTGLASNFHTYTLDWTPDSVVWRMDGVVQRKTVAPDQQVLDMRDSAQTWRMNLWASNSTGWVGKLDLTKLPVYQVVNWMRYSSYTPGKGENGSNFTFSWLDDFDKFDTQRWAKGDWTFDGNLAQLTTVNIAAKSGYLVLALTTPEADGVSGVIPKDPAGDTYGTASVRGTARDLPLRAIGTSNGIRIEGAQPGFEIAVRNANGQILTQVDGSVSEIPLAARGVMFVQAGSRSIAVVR